MNTLEDCLPDMMQVCRNGHVITDLLRSCPESGRSHCDHCGATTIERCLTCGQDLPGAWRVPGLVPVGRAKPPQFCAACGAAFPWTEAAPVAPSSPLTFLETLLRRLPRAIRQLRHRHGDRPAFRVQDVHDLEDLLRGLLPLHFDDFRPEARTPSYSPDTRTDFLLPWQAIAVVAKYIGSGLCESQLARQWTEDVAYYRRRGGCRALIGVAYDPEGLLIDPRVVEASLGRNHECEGELELRFVIAR